MLDLITLGNHQLYLETLFWDSIQIWMRWDLENNHNVRETDPAGLI